MTPEDILRFVESLDERDSVVLDLRYGITGGIYSLAEIGRILKISVERVRQRLALAEESLANAAFWGTVPDRPIGEYLEVAAIRSRAAISRQPTAAEAAVALLSGLVAKGAPPIERFPSQFTSYFICWHCGANLEGDHKPDCPYQAAKAFLAGLPSVDS